MRQSVEDQDAAHTLMPILGAHADQRDVPSAEGVDPDDARHRPSLASLAPLKPRALDDRQTRVAGKGGVPCGARAA
jgi:hypothetical protein